jgi:hypothetical protein
MQHQPTVRQSHICSTTCQPCSASALTGCGHRSETQPSSQNHTAVSMSLHAPLCNPVLHCTINTSMAVTWPHHHCFFEKPTPAGAKTRLIRHYATQQAPSVHYRTANFTFGAGMPASVRTSRASSNAPTNPDSLRTTDPQSHRALRTQVRLPPNGCTCPDCGSPLRACSSAVAGQAASTHQQSHWEQAAPG